ncbi:TAXI family TRAP transporter solute-binding subunit [Halovulum dunhuangense]|uniref:TAXI family TRAP transporter solute-binding subunit n=1 Tax=Halovulum dunhuangense TaxID=1505036 RepID=A0A849L305_9RHOB|nr:TAXI family TRAP transporter solute-binding subunit [Halovulum dunhuangense]NNU80602.1 TAXI family TRAP transporter solute-binding subunit [Halovulum dunhuangense]
MRRGAILAGLFAAALAQGAGAQDHGFLAIGAGSVGGVYYPTASAICRLVNRETDRHGARCAAQASGGSVANIEAIRDGSMEFAVVQGDIERAAMLGEGPFEGVALPELRAVFAAHSEPFTLIVREGSGIAGIADLRGRRVNLGAPGSGQRVTTERVLAAQGLDIGSIVSTEASGRAVAAEICGGGADALIYTIGHPAAILREAAETCDLRFLPVGGPEIDALLEESPAYSRAVIPAGLYPGTETPVESFAVGSALVTRVDVDDALVATVARAVLGNLAEFRAQHPALVGLDPKAMLSGGTTAPLHPGALAAYRDMGLID